jgi:hypothetical protein
MPPFTVKLMSLRCLVAQEADGDEIYINVNGRTIWSVGTMRMSARPADADQISEIDFAEGTKHTANGIESLPMENKGDFVLAGQTEPVLIQIKERDMLLGDDLIGEAAITERDAGRGRIQIAFTGEGAHYMLTYEVTA